MGAIDANACRPGKKLLLDDELYTVLERAHHKPGKGGAFVRFKLKGIVSADDSGAQIGINDAIKAHSREDIIRVAAGNSKVGMDFVKEGTLHAITYQSAESDGALPMKLTADWFMGKPIAKSVYYLRKHIITKKDVDQFMPAQW